MNLAEKKLNNKKQDETELSSHSYSYVPTRRYAFDHYNSGFNYKLLNITPNMYVHLVSCMHTILFYLTRK